MKILKLQILCLLVLQLNSCSFLSFIGGKKSEVQEEIQLSRRDYWLHWKKLSNDFKETHKSLLAPPPPSVHEYLKQIVKNVEKKNEIFFENDPNVEISFLIFKDKRPFYFALPTGEIILSTRLVEKYIDHEGALLSVIIPEFIRVKKVIYPKLHLLPMGFMELEKMLSIQRLSFDVRMKLHQWSYYLMLRSNFHPNQYLSWIQLQNRNHVDFSFYLADSIVLVKEEAYLKQFIVNNYGKLEFNPLNLKSSKDFYKFQDTYRSSL